ncbi:MAG: glutaredoxin [Patescibacteria group bacterium]|nr:glutaredoxin [Patescibacteria group bacterium]
MKKITVYSTATCHFCHMEKDFLNAHSVAFEDHVIAPDDMKTKEYLADLTGQMGVPVTVIVDTDHPDADPQVIVGFSEPLFVEKLGLTV